MKNQLLAVALTLCAGTALAQNPAAPNTRESLAIGASVPMATTKMHSATTGGEATLASAKTSKGLLVMFSCNTCPYVVKSQARTREVLKAAKDAGIGAIVVNSNAAYRDETDSYGAMKKYAVEQGYSAPYVVDEDSKLADAFGATRTPEVFLFDGSGKLVYKGAMEDNPATPAESTKFYLTDAMQKMLAGQAVDPVSTKSIGCSIKRKG
jgi:hypothetical protein